jgi:non-lysosomal glucosylceramidase
VPQRDGRSSALPVTAAICTAARAASAADHCDPGCLWRRLPRLEEIRDYVGCGLGNVNHVWNYAQTVAFLFPELEQTMRSIEFHLEIGRTARCRAGHD